MHSLHIYRAINSYIVLNLDELFWKYIYNNIQQQTVGLFTSFILRDLLYVIQLRQFVQSTVKVYIEAVLTSVLVI